MHFKIVDFARRDLKYHPRHLQKLISVFGGEDMIWCETLAEISGRDGLLVVRSPSAHSLMGSPPTPLNPQGSSLFSRLTSEEKTLLSGQRVKLVLDLGWEPLFCRDDIVTGLHAALTSAGVDPGCVRIVHSNKAGRAFEALWKTKFQEPAPRTIYFPVGLALCSVHQWSLRSPHEVKDRLASARGAVRDRSKDKSFNSFNGEARPNRLIFLAYLAAHGLLDDALVSMLAYSKGGKDVSVESLTLKALAATKGFRHRDAVVPHVPDAIARLPMILDVPGDKPASIEEIERLAFASPDQQFFDRTAFSVVLDTLFADEDMVFVTEKIAKPIMNASPFIYIGNPEALTLLENLGFASYAPFVREDYAQVADPMTRFSDALDEVTRLARLGTNDRHQFALDAWPIAETNFLYFWGDFKDHLKGRLHRDVLQAL